MESSYLTKRLLLLLCSIAFSAGATTRTVTNTSDNGQGSLRDTIAASTSGDTIDFTAGLTGTITLTNGQLALTTNLTISGPGAGVLNISGHTNSRVFNITGGTVNLSGLGISDGSSGSGGGIANTATLNLSSCIFSNNSADTPGGAILNSGTLSVSRCMFRNNSVRFAVGGGLMNSGTASVNDSTFFNNIAVNTNNPGGGALFSFGTLTLTNCTISGNFAGRGAGISTLPGAVVKMSGCTVCSNQCSNGTNGNGGGIYFGGASLEIQNSIIAGNSSSAGGPDVFVAGANVLVSDGHNLIGDTNGSTGWVASDLIGSSNALLDAKLGPLQENGGPSWTHALKPGSPAIDAGRTFGRAADQRGRSLVVDLPYIADAVGGDGSDIGAFELNPPMLNIARVGAYVLLFWPTSDPDYVLQSSDSLSPPAWAPFADAPVVVGNHYIAVDNVMSRHFYRLRQ